MKNTYNTCHKYYKKKGCMQRKVSVNSFSFTWNTWVFVSKDDLFDNPKKMPIPND